MLADVQIVSSIKSGDIKIHPYERSSVQPASIDLRLGSGFIKYGTSSEPLDPERPDDFKRDSFSAEKLILYPGEFILGTTLELVELSPWIAARVEGKSTLGRLGLIIHSTAGFVDPGFTGNITLEMTNINTRPIILRACMKICQMAFYRMDMPVERPYGHKELGSHYQGQKGVTPASAMAPIS